jgi:hypothetical protein
MLGSSYGDCIKMFQKCSLEKIMLLSGVAIIAFSSLFVVKFAPLNAQEKFVVRVKDGSVKTVLKPTGELRQEFTGNGELVKGIKFYFDKIRGVGGLKFEITDKDGHVVAKNGQAGYAYSDARTDANFSLARFRLNKDEKYNLVLKNDGRDDISFWARDLSAGRRLIAFSLSVPQAIGFRSAWGIGAGVLFLIGLTAIQFMSDKWKTITVICLLVVVTPMALAGFWKMDKFGISDWDYYMSTHSAYRQAILVNHVFPFWEPYTAGGTAGLADPEFPVFSPLFIPELLFGIPIGMRLAVMFSVLGGGLGMLALSRSLKLSIEASTLTAIAFMFGSVNLLEIVEGHTNIYMAMWIPWIFWAWLEMLHGKRKPIVCGIFLALTFYGGGIYLLMYTAIAFVGLGLFTKKRVRTLWLTIQAGLWALGLSALKLIPVFLWLKQYPDTMYASSVNILPWLKQIFLERIPHGVQAIYGQGGGWHEYGAYLGYFVLLMSTIGLMGIRKNKIIRLLFLATIVATLLSSSGPLVKSFFDVFPYMPRSNVSRFILFAVIPLVLLAGFGVDFIKTKIKFGNFVTILIIGCVAIDLMIFSFQLSSQAFVLQPFSLTMKAAYPLEFTADKYVATSVDKNGNDVPYSRSYAAFLAGYGSTAFPSVVGPDARVKTIQDEKHLYVELENNRGSAKLLTWNPNKVAVTVDAKEADLLIINTNYATGWYANGAKAVEVAGRVATRVGPGPQTVTFQYKTPGLWPGVIISFGTLIMALFFWRRNGSYAITG